MGGRAGQGRAEPDRQTGRGEQDPTSASSVKMVRVLRCRVLVRVNDNQR